MGLVSGEKVFSLVRIGRLSRGMALVSGEEDFLVAVLKRTLQWEEFFHRD